MPAKIFLLYLSSFVLEGPLRFGLDAIGASSLIYGRDILALTTILLAAGTRQKWASSRTQKNLLIAMFLLLMHAIWGWIALDSLTQVAFGFKLYIPILFGIACSEYVLKNLEEFKKYYMILLAISIAGIFINYFYEMPWAGKEYEIGGRQIRAAKDWYIGETKRAYGFARSSSTVAAQLLLLWIVIVCTKHSIATKALATTFTIIAIIITTTKGIYLTFIAITAYAALKSIAPNSNHAHVAYKIFIPLLCILAPLVAVIFEPKYSELRGFERLAFSSFLDRAANTWPNLVNFMWNEGTLFTGRGLGGVGTAQLYFEPSHYNPADNVFLTFWATFGVLGFVYFILISAPILFIKPTNANSSGEKLFPFIYITFFTYGLTTPTIEGAELACFAGILFGRLLLLPQLPQVKYSQQMHLNHLPSNNST